MPKRTQQNNSWQVKKIGEVCDVIAGQSPEGKFYNKSENGLPFYQGKKEFGEKYIGEPTTWTTRITKEAKKNDILMSVRAPVGPVNFATQKICIGRGLAAIRTGEDIDKDFLFNFLRLFEDEIVGNKGAIFNSINKTQIENIEIPLPPLSTQRRIVKKLDSVFEKTEKAKQNAEKNLQNSKELFESCLRDIFADSGKDWDQEKLIKLTTKIGSGSTPRGGRKSYKTEGISLIRSLNVHDDGLREKNLAHIDNKQADKLSNVIIQDQDVLLNITGASVARCCLAPKNVLPARVNQHVSIIRVKKKFLFPEFLHYLLISKEYKQKLLKTGEEGGSTRQAITKIQIQNFIVKFPNLTKQKQITKKLDNLSKQTKKLETNYQKKLENLEELKKSVLKKAFEGKL